MGDISTATVFDHNGALAVNLPEGFHAPDGKVNIIREGDFIRIEPIRTPPSPDQPNLQAERTLAELREWIRHLRAEAAANPKPLQTIGRKLSLHERRALLGEIQDLTAGEFMPFGREQPPMPDDDEHSFD
jgi:virulence-associated protein VagC